MDGESVGDESMDSFEMGEDAVCHKLTASVETTEGDSVASFESEQQVKQPRWKNETMPGTTRLKFKLLHSAAAAPAAEDTSTADAAPAAAGDTSTADDNNKDLVDRAEEMRERNKSGNWDTFIGTLLETAENPPPELSNDPACGDECDAGGFACGVAGGFVSMMLIVSQLRRNSYLLVEVRKTALFERVSVKSELSGV
jgi:hypothetical protein